MMVPTTHLDLSLEVFGIKMFAPVMAGPIAKLQTYHPDDEIGVARAASAAKAWMVVSSESSMPLEKIAAESTTRSLVPGLLGRRAFRIAHQNGAGHQAWL